MVRSDRQVEQRLLLLAGQRDGRGPDARAALAVRLRPQDRHRPRRRGHRRAAVHRVEAQRAYKKPEQQKWYAGETISLGIGQGYNNFTMLQLASATATLVSGGQRFKPRLVREIEDVVTRERKRVASDALEPLPLKPEHVELINRALHGVTQEGTSARVVRRRAVPERRQDRHRAGGGHPRRTRSTTPPSSRSTSATTRCTSPSRRSRRRPSRWRWSSRTPASAPRPRRRSRAASSTTCCSACARARRTWRHARGQVRRADRQAAAAPPRCRCPAACRRRPRPRRRPAATRGAGAARVSTGLDGA